MRHLIKDEHDAGTELWCNDPSGEGWRGAAVSLSETTCQECLRAVKRFGHEATMQLLKVIGKDWNACPYESHAADCDCGGQGGDR